jgi:PAS domain S-box-containing protein
MEHKRHEELISGITEEYRDILEGSRQGVYVYLDDTHKLCNRRFAKMLGYSERDWAMTEPFTDAFVAPRSQAKLVHAYRDALTRGIGSKINVTWKKRDGKNLRSDVILVPIKYAGERFALHYVTAS